MKNLYPASCGMSPYGHAYACLPGILPSLSRLKRPLRFAAEIFVLLMAPFLMTVSGIAQPNDNHLDTKNELVKSGYDQYGLYYDFTLHYYNDDNYDSYIKEGSLTCILESGQVIEVAHLHSWKQKENDDADPVNYAADVKSPSGVMWVASWEYDYPDLTNGRDRGIWLSAGVSTTVSGTTNSRFQGGSGGCGNVRCDHAKYGNINEDALVYIRWYVPGQYAGQNLTFNYSATADIDDNDKDASNLGFVKMPQLSKQPFSSLSVSDDFSDQPGMFALSYRFSDKNVFGTTVSFNGQSQSFSSSAVPSGSFNIRLTNHAQSKSLTASANLQAYADGRYAASYSTTQNTTVPAYIWPDTLYAAYNGEDSVTLRWQVNTPDGDDYMDGDNFEIQRSTDPGFQNNVRSVGVVPYDKDQTDYTLADNLSDLQGGAHVYYRLRRTKSSAKWNWKVARTTDLAVTLNTSRDTTRDTVMLDNAAGARAILHFDPFRGVWLTGTRFVLTRMNETAHQSTTIELDETTARSGEYTDDNIAYCNDYTYTIALTLGNGYTSPDESAVRGHVLAVEIGTISELFTSKGYFPDRVELRWHTDGGFDNYIVKRKVYGSADDYIQVASVAMTTSREVEADDAKAAPGVYYSYLVMGAVHCGDAVRYSDTLRGIGFRSPTGNLSGQIKYGNGQAVEQAVVRLETADTTVHAQSIRLTGAAESYLRLDSLHTPFQDQAFTLAAWIKPDDAHPEDQVLFSRPGQYELGFDSDGRLYFDYHGQRVQGVYENKDLTFVHLTAIHHADTLMLMLNDSVIASASYGFVASGAPNGVVYIGRNAGGNHFKGYIDEVCGWNRALTAGEVARNYTRLLSGDEPGLVAYWRFDETIADAFYDLSHEGDQYHQNDGVMDPSYAMRTDMVPTAGQLSLKAYTDSSGNYAITGIPYVGSNGTTYNIVPVLGTHQFDPIHIQRLFSANSPSYTVDFTDVSSFPVSGFVYYRHSRVPVPGVQFLIDGKYAQQANGALIQTGTDGKFEVSVPVGTHEVKAVKNSHVFVNAGRITDSRGHDLNYQTPVSERILYDSTTVRFIGRVAGGAVQEAFPLGHSLSKNNLGKSLEITLNLPSDRDQWLVADEMGEEGGDSTVVVNHLVPSGKAGDSAKPHHTRVDWRSAPGVNQIVIHPDSLTGEFEADLFPVEFIVSQVTATGWKNILEGDDAMSLDLTNKFFKDSSVYSYQDSTQLPNGDWSHQHYTDTVYFNYAYKFIKRVIPTVSIEQVTQAGKTMHYFGDSIYQSETLSGSKAEVPLWDPSKTGTDRYLLGGHPVFSQAIAYHFKISSFEKYPFYISEAGGVGVPAEEDGEAVVDLVPTQDGHVSFYNDLKTGTQSGQQALDTLSLDSTGVAYYDFIAGDPATAPGDGGLKSFSATVRFGGATDVNWQWYGADDMKAFVMGSNLAGTDFVTAGPNRLLMVLRDPPGNRSYSFAEQGSTVTSSTTYTGTIDNSTDAEIKNELGSTEVTFFGGLVGVGYISEIEAKNELGLGIKMEEHYTHNDTKVSSTQLTTRFQTSDASTFVGAPADLFVGYSTNITYGQSRKLTILKREDIRANDSVVLDPGGDYVVVATEGLSLGEKFGTLFAYPQQHIETVLIPNLIKVRNSLLLPPSTPSTEAQAAANEKNQEIYVSKLALDDPDFGKSNNDPVFHSGNSKGTFDDGGSYKIYFPQGPDASDYRTDTIMTINQYIAQWERALADNEKAKLESKLLQNYSFHAGNPVNYSEQTTFTRTRTDEFNFILSNKVFIKTGLELNGLGFKVNSTEEIGTQQGGNTESGSEDASTLGFELAADGVGEYISVDVNKTDDGGLAFRTKGGETECPYEGVDTTKYYQPGTVIGLPTAQMDKPEITVDQAVVNNVPATQSAAYTIHLINASEAAWSTDFVLSYGSTDSVQGANISVDGVSIAAGRSYPVIYGEPVTKVLTITKGPNAMDYNNIPIILHSVCQYDPTGYQAIIADTVLLSAHFVPSCSNVAVKSPADNWVLNNLSPVNSSGAPILPVVLDQFDESNSLFDHIALQYKPAAASQWITVMNFYGDSAKYNDAQGDKAFITNAQEIHYDFPMDEASFNDQKYDIRALAVCALSPGNLITTPSAIVSGTKDTYTPRLFGSPEPATGVLGPTGQVRLNFNETIAGGLLTHNDFQVTGIRNGALTDHSVSVSLDGKSDYLETEFKKNLAGRDLTAELWILPATAENAVLISHGNAHEALELGITADNHVEVRIGPKSITSDKPVDAKAGEWAHVALVYDATDSTVSAFYNFQEVIHGVKTDGYAGNGVFDFGRSVRSEGEYFRGKMHGVRIWTKSLTATTLQVNSLMQLSGAQSGLMAYYPMTEGKGAVVHDKAHANHATLTGTWSTPPGKAAAFGGDGYLRLPTGAAPITRDMDFTLEFWFKAAPGQSEATLMSNGKGDGTDPGSSENLFFLGFEGGRLTFRNNGFKAQATGNYLDNQWHQVALAVNRTAGVAQWYIDGELNQYFDAGDLGGIAAPFMYLGVRGYYDPADLVTPRFDRYFTGNIDGVRLWNTYLGSALISDKSNVRLAGNELGLMLYYPFERYISFQNNKELDSTTMDMKSGGLNQLTLYAQNVHASITDDMAPIKDRGPVDNLQFDYVVNNDALIINLLEPKQAVDKTIVTFRVSNARDLNGNPMASPVTWTAYIDQNPLKWGDDAFNLVKGVDSVLQFTTYISNSGGSVEHFTMDNLPPWLTASISQGTVDPEGKQMVTFTVDKGLNVGSYDDIIYMRNDNGETESLAISLKVQGKAPAWTVNPGDYKYNMTLYGKIKVNGLFSDNPDDILAAFKDGQCVGLTHNTYFKDNDLWYAFLTIYGNDVAYEGLSFRIWDAGTGKVYEGMPSVPVHFVNDTIIGTARNPVIFEGRELLFQHIDLNKGWNWISYNLESPDLASVPATLANGNWRSGDIVKNNELGFDEYSAGAGWVGYLQGFNNTSLFMLQAAQAQTLSVSGTVVDVTKTGIPLKGGRWNYISYLPQANMTVKDALAGYEASEDDVIKSQTGFAMYDARIGWIGNLTYLEPGKGYMFYRKAPSDTVFHYPSIPGILRLAFGHDAMDGLRLNAAEQPVAGNYLYANNMTVVAVTGKGVTLLPGDEVMAYAGTELRARAKPITNPLTKSPALFFNIAGENSQLIHFEVKRNGTTVAQTGPVMSFRPDGIIGSVQEPFVLDFERPVESADIYPNPFHTQLSVHLVLSAGTHKLQMSIYDVKGRLIKAYAPVSVNSPDYQLVWDGTDGGGGTCNAGVYFLHLYIDGQAEVYKIVKL